MEMKSLTITELPYDAFEVILSLLDGISFLSVSCVCKNWHKWCDIFINRPSRHFWRAACQKELNGAQLQHGYSGNFQENWFTVYKSAHLENTIRSRNIRRDNIPLIQRFIRCRTGVHFLGHMLVVTQGPVINLYDILTGTHIGSQQAGHFNIHHSFVLRKSLSVLNRNGYPCDILVMLCGGAKVSHIAVTTAHTILTSQLQIIPCHDNQRYFQCSLSCSHIAFPTYCINISVDRSDGVKLTKDRNCFGGSCFPRVGEMDSAEPSHKNAIIKLNDNILLTRTSCGEGSSDEVIISNCAKTDVYQRITLDGHLLESRLTGYDKCDFARVVHIGEDIIPAIAAVLMNREYGKQLVLYTLTLD